MAKKRTIETTTDLEEIVAEQDAGILGLGTLVRAMDPTVKNLEQKVESLEQKIKLQQALIDGMYAILVAHGLAKPRPAEEPPLVH